MFETVRNAFKIKDIRNGIIFTFLMLIVIRLGCQLPVPGINRDFFAEWFSQITGDSDSFNFFNAFTGGSFENMSLFALNITPYITSSIIIQLLTIAIPALEEMHKEGEEGRKKLVAITRYVTVGLALVESLAMAIGFGRQGILEKYDALNVIMVILTLTAGSAFLMWIGEQITEYGVGDMTSLYTMFVAGRPIAFMILNGAIILAIILLTIVLTILLNDAERRIPVQYAKKMQGRKQYGGNSTYIPLKVNTGNVIPIIFASSIMQFPVVIAQLFGKTGGTSAWGHILRALSSSNWFDADTPWYTIGALVYILLVIFFAYFYTSITFNPLEIADNMKKQGGFIPGIRPGKPTSDYLTKILNYIIFIGAVGLVIVAMIPIFFNGAFNANVTFGGTSLIIIVGVILETLKQIESKMVVRNYKGFLS